VTGRRAVSPIGEQRLPKAGALSERPLLLEKNAAEWMYERLKALFEGFEKNLDATQEVGLQILSLELLLSTPWLTLAIGDPT